MTIYLCLNAEPTALPWLGDGATIAFVGDNLLEREQKFGFIETEIQARFPDRKLHFRNLAWSADTPTGLSRAYFDPPSEGTKRLREHHQLVKPTAVIVSYSKGLALEADFSQAACNAQWNQLDEILNTASPKEKRPHVIWLGPIPQADLGSPWPSPAKHNARLLEIRNLLAGRLKNRKDEQFVDLWDFSIAKSSASSRPWTDNGVILNEWGFHQLAMEISKRFDAEFGKANEGHHDGFSSADLLAVADVERTPDSLSATLTWKYLPSLCPIVHEKLLAIGRQPTLSVKLPSPGEYRLEIKGTPSSAITASAEEWEKGVVLVNLPDQEQARELNHLIRRKDELFFQRYRPQNITYLLGFRKYEQGQNAKEIIELDQKVSEVESRIWKIKKPVPHRFVFKRVSKQVTPSSGVKP